MNFLPAKVGHKEKLTCESSSCQLHEILSQMGVSSKLSVKEDAGLPVDFHNVRIRPRRIEFTGGFEGKQFKARITLQNVGKHTVFVRMMAPTSYVYTIKSFPRGISLSPGLSVERAVEMVYTQVCVNLCILPIYVDEHRYDLELEVSSSTPELRIAPNFVDFGCVDAGLTSLPRRIEMANVGSKGTKFSFDLVGAQRDLIIEPIRGYLAAKQRIIVTFRLLTYKEGLVNMEVWIRCENPKVIAIKGMVIVAKFEAIHPNTTSAFTLVDFPSTYLGTTYTRTLLIRNYSSTSSMFCVLGELHDGRMLSLQACRRESDCFKFFDVCPSEGRFEPKETKLFQLRFQPKKSKMKQEKKKGYYFVAIQIYKINCRDVIPTSDTFYEDDTEPILAYEPPTPSSFVESANLQNDAPLLRSNSSVKNVNIAVKAQRPFVRVYLHGLADDPKVTVVPDELILLELKVSTKATRVLELKNNSTNLPIILHYKKVAYIDLERNIFLKPSEKKQISVVILHHCVGMLHTQITFDLLDYGSPKTKENCKNVGTLNIPVTLESVAITTYPSPIINTGLRPNYIKEVGKFCGGLKYTDLMNWPKTLMVDGKPNHKRDDLIAFPNDRSTSLRPWKGGSNQCTTIFTRKPRYVPPLDQTYELSIFDRQFKKEVDAYYTRFTRMEAGKLRCLQKMSRKAIADEYSFVETFKVNFNNAPTLCGMMRPHKIVRADCFLPLSPIELNMISVSPTVIETGKIACYNGFNVSITITNKNSLSLRLFLRPDKPAVLFPQSSRRIIAPHSQNQIEMTYVAGPPGYYVVAVDILVNESTIAQVVILADVVPHSLQLSTYNIYLDGEQIQEYIDIINNLNVPISYFWDIPFCNFCVEPYNGCVRPYNTLTCVLTYYSHIGGPNVADCEFHSGERDVQLVKIICEMPTESIELITKNVKFENMPLNIRVTRYIFFRNPFKQALSYSIIESELGEDLHVTPENGIVAGRQLLEITLSAKFENCITFSTFIKIDINRMGIFEIPVSGNVVYPSLKITPDTFQFKTIPFSSTNTIEFSIENRSAAIATIQIDLSDYNDYKVSESRFHWEPPLIDEIVIEAAETKTFFVHYLPMECAISTLYLPMIVNGILGPPIISDPITLKVDYYLKAKYSGTTAVNVPINLDLVKINGLAKAGKIMFSKKLIDFTLGTRTERRYRTRYEFKITNCQKDRDDVCIRTDELQTNPFVMEPVSSNMEMSENSVVCLLQPNEAAIINIIFDPDRYGYYRCFLPVYLRSDMSMEFHNIIELRGNYITPSIVGERLTFRLPQGDVVNDLTTKLREPPKKMTFYSRPIPLKIVACSTKKYTFKDHYKGCQISTTTDLPGMSIHIETDTFAKLNDTDYEIELTFKYSAEENTQFRSTVRISCTCGAIWEAGLIGCAENCFMTSYAFSETFLPELLEAVTMLTDANKGYSYDLDSLFQARPSLLSAMSRRDIGHLIPNEFQTVEFFSSYPFFPTEVTPLTYFLEHCLFCMEEWLCNQTFYKTIRYQIPETITFCQTLQKYENIAIRSKMNRKSNFMVPPYAKLLLNMVGPTMVTDLELGPAPATDEGVCWYLYHVYDNAICFIKSLGAYFICLQPEHLLDYNMFLMFKKYILPTFNSNIVTISTSIKNSQEFYYLAKQSWLDLLLQTYKVLYLYRLSAIRITAPVTSALDVSIKPMDDFKKSVKDFTKNANIFSSSELMLINWLQFHYMGSKDEIWDKNSGLQKRDVNFFGENLQDGFVFAAVTGAYCPYMVPYLKKMLCGSEAFEELLHNNCVLTRCWRMLNFSFTIRPEDLIDPNSVQMLMLIGYLYEVLPTMYPEETIKFKTGLSQKIHNTIVMKNINEFPICYKVIFFSNCESCFTTDNEFYVIEPEKARKIKISYHAKNACDVECTLLLSGENAGYHYAKNRAFTLTGTADISYMTSTITYPIYLYRVSEISFTVKSPYEVSAIYDIQLAYKMIEKAADLANVPFVDKVDTLHLSKLMPNEPCGQFNEQGIYQFNGTCAAISMQDQAVWIYFRNEKVGDFAVNLIIQVKGSTSKEVIDVVLPKNFLDLEVSRLKREQIFMEIPCQNRLLWNSVKEIVLKISRDDVLEFWKNNIGTLLGMQLLQQIVLGAEGDLALGSCSSVTYQIIADKNCDVILPETLTFHNECSTASVKLPLRFTTNLDCPRNFNFSMQTPDGKTRRYYKANFLISHEQ